MIHLVGIALMGSGVAAAAVPWKKVGKKAVKRLRKKPSQAQQLAADESSETLSTAQNTQTVVVEQTEQHLIASNDDNGQEKYRLAKTTGVLALCGAAQIVALPALTAASVAVLGYFSYRIFKEAAEAIGEKKIKVDILDATVISLCVLFGQIAAAGLMLWILDVADELLQRTQDKSKLQISNIFGEQVSTAWLVVDGSEIETPVEKLNVGDIIVVNTGEQIPVDGTVVAGSAMVDQQSLTGESAPVDKQEDSDVFATTVLVAGKIQIAVKEKGEDTVASRIVKIIDEAASFKVSVQSSGEKIADQMVVPTLGLGTLGLAMAGPSGMLAIINADFGTGIRVAAPIALLASLGHAAQSGVLIKDSKIFELLREIDVVLFDKTGTLTSDTPRVSNIVLGTTGHSQDEVLRLTASAEQKFSHPIARAILEYAQERELEIPAHDDSKYHVGLGIEVMVEGSLIQVGSARYIEQQEISLTPDIADALELTREHGMSAILIAIDGQIAGLIELSANIRDEASDVIQLLRSQGVQEVVLISGDHEAPTKKLSGELGIDRYFAGVMPHEKADYVKLLQDEGKKVMMVGDGINDSAALSLADIAVSLKGASTIAVDVADIVFMDGGLSKFDYLYEATDSLQNNVKRSFSLIAIPNSVCILGGLFGVFGLASSLVLNNGFNILATLNGTRSAKDINYLTKSNNSNNKTAA